MARAKKTATAAPEAAQDGQEAQGVTQDIQAQEAASDSAQTVPEAAQDVQEAQEVTQDIQAQEAASDSAQAAPEAAQDGQEAQGVTQDTQTQEAAPDGPLEAAEPVRETAGPEGPDDLPGRQDEDEAELDETEFIEYAVKGCKRLNLREEPRLDAPVVAELPYGVGVLGNSRPAENGWRQVFTGRLFGWVMDEFLEPLELGDGAD